MPIDTKCLIVIFWISSHITLQARKFIKLNVIRIFCIQTRLNLTMRYQLGSQIFVIDIYKQNDTEIDSAVDVVIEIEALESIKGVSDYCLLIQDRIIVLVPLNREVKKLV